MEPLLTVSQLVKRHLRHHIERYYKEIDDVDQFCGVPSLQSLAADAKVQSLEEENGIYAALIQMAEKFDILALRLVIENPKATYRLLHAFHNLQIDEGRCALDLDDAIIRNERFLSRRPNGDGKYLVSLEYLVKILPNVTVSEPNVITFVRRDPPIGGEFILLFTLAAKVLPLSDRHNRLDSSKSQK